MHVGVALPKQMRPLTYTDLLPSAVMHPRTTAGVGAGTTPRFSQIAIPGLLYPPLSKFFRNSHKPLLSLFFPLFSLLWFFLWLTRLLGSLGHLTQYLLLSRGSQCQLESPCFHFFFPGAGLSWLLICFHFRYRIQLTLLADVGKNFQTVGPH